MPARCHPIDFDKPKLFFFRTAPTHQCLNERWPVKTMVASASLQASMDW